MALWDVGTAYLASNESTEWFVHGFSDRDWVAFSVSALHAGCESVPDARATLTQGRSSEHVDGTQGYTVTIQNTGIDCVRVRLIANIESL